MNNFRFFEDVKHTIWLRNHFEIEAETQEEADKKAIELFNQNHIPDEDWEYLNDTIEEMRPIENDNWPTRQLFNETGDLAQNAPDPI